MPGGGGGEGRNIGIQFSLSFLFSLIPLNHGIVPPTLRVDLPTSINLTQAIFHKHA